MVLRSKSVGEQDVADQQGAFLCREDLTFMGSSFLGGNEFVISTSLFLFEILKSIHLASIVGLVYRWRKSV